MADIFKVTDAACHIFIFNEVTPHVCRNLLPSSEVASESLSNQITTPVRAPSFCKLLLYQQLTYNFSLAEFYKAAKLGANGDVKNKGKSAAVEDEEDEGEAGPELPPDFEEDMPDDEEGRFFGGGMTKETSQAMEYLDQQDKDEVAAVSERKRNGNFKMRWI